MTVHVSGLVHDDLLREVLEANLVIPREGLATLTWGNVSGLDRERGIYVIKPSGVPYDELAVEHLVPVEVDTGRVLAGDLKPSTDSETHRLLYLERSGTAASRTPTRRTPSPSRRPGGRSRCSARPTPTPSMARCR